jgi:hypothetical protein
VRRFKGKSLAQLLDDPTARRMLCDVDVQDASTIVADDEEAVEHAERDRWHRQKIHCGNRFPMVAKEGQPALGAVGIFWRSLHPTGDIIVLSERSKPSMRSSPCIRGAPQLNDGHLRSLLKEWVTHYNRGRPHASLGPGIPDLRAGQQRAKLCGHHVLIDQQVVTKALLGGLHHEYSLERRAA